MKENNNRREFLKKVAYKAPVVLALGSLMTPLSAKDSNVSAPYPGAHSAPRRSTSNDNAGLDSTK